jgi:hypothetical protein
VTNKKLIFRFIGIILFISSIGSAEIIDTAKPIELQTKPVLKKVGSVNQLSAVTADYSNMHPIDGVAIRFKSELEPTVLFRFMNSKGNWSDWRSTQLFKESNTDRWIASSIEPIAKKSIQYEVQITAGGNSDIQLYEYGIFPHEEIEKVDSIPKIKLFPTEIPKPIIITRQEWGARAPNGNYTQTLLNNKLTLHHAAGWPAANIQEGKQAVKEIQDFHIDGRGWTDIAYHFLVDDAGNIYQGRPETVQGAHTYMYNEGNIGLCVLGCFDPPYEVSAGIPCHQYLTDEARDAVVHLFAWLIETYGYANADILKGHRDYYDYERTSCPGQNIHQLLPELRNEINEFVKFGGPPFDYSLLNNYPNPFNSTTNIEYGIPVDCNVTINIYNTLGEKITTLVNNELQIKGTHTIKWNGKNTRNELVHSGIYYYQIQTEQNINDDVKKHYTETGKMLFLK